MNDYRDLSLSGANTEALSHFERALAGFHCYAGDPLSDVGLAIDAAPQFTMAHVLKANLMVSGTELPGVNAAADVLKVARALPANPRERVHLKALEALTAGAFAHAVNAFEAILMEYPRDVLAMQMAHLFDFVQGDSLSMRDRPARAAKEWSSDLPGYHAVLAMHAFGLEECGQYREAEVRGREALDLNARDAWAHHAVTHVYEMQGRPEEGLKWMSSREQHWSEDNMIAVHNWWHCALFRLEMEDVAGAMALYDSRIRAGRSVVALDLIDASALLWRLRLRNVDVGNRWLELANAWSQHLNDDYYVFNNWHALIAMLGAERWRDAEHIVSLMEARMIKPGDNGAMTARAGLPIARGFLHFARNEFAQCVTMLGAVRNEARRFGGSHAQRDLIDLTLIEAAKRDRQISQVRLLAEERLQRKPASALALRYATEVFL